MTNELLPKITIDKTIDAFSRMGFTLFNHRDFNLNIFGVRSNLIDSDAFNDVIGVLYKDQGVWHLAKYEATTVPGIKSRTDPVNEKGCAILVPGQYRSAFKIGYHKGKYKALVQNKPLPLYRDNDLDANLDFDNMALPELAGINIHHANTSETNPSVIVHTWSAGCQVIRRIVDWRDFMELVETSADLYGDKFTYTLFTQDEYLG